jgi:hypothetical protein
VADIVTWQSATTLHKYSPEQGDRARAELGRHPTHEEIQQLCGDPEHGVHEDLESNLLTTAGLARITALITGTGQAATATSLRLGVGDGTGPAAIGDTDLSAAAGSTHRQFYVVDGGYPTESGGLITVKATFAGPDANFVWNEWCLDIGTPTVANGTTVNACLLDHKISSQGTKVSGAVWAFTVSVTLS